MNVKIFETSGGKSVKVDVVKAIVKIEKAIRGHALPSILIKYKHEK